MELLLTDENENDLELENIFGDMSEQDIEEFDEDEPNLLTFD